MLENPVDIEILLIRSYICQKIIIVIIIIMWHYAKRFMNVITFNPQ